MITRKSALFFMMLLCCFTAINAQQNLNYQPSLFNFGVEVNVISFRQNSVDSPNVTTGPKLGVRLNQYVSPSFDLNFHFLSAKSDPFELSKFIYSQSQFAQFGADIDYKLNNGYLLREESRISPFISIGYTSSNYRKIGDGDDFKIRTNTFGGGVGTSYRINDKIKAHYRLAYRHNFDGYTTNTHHQFGITFRLFSPIRVVESEPSDSMVQATSTIVSVKSDSTTADSLVELAFNDQQEEILKENVFEKDSGKVVQTNKTRVVAIDGSEVDSTAETQAKLLPGNYYIILGAFRNYESAKELYSVVGKDVPGTAILETGLDIYRVGVKVGPDSSLARSEQEFFRIHGFPDAWILDKSNPVPPVVKENISDLDKIEEEISDPDELSVAGESDSEQVENPDEDVIITSEVIPGAVDTTTVSDKDNQRVIRSQKITSDGIIPGYYVVIASFLDPENALEFQNRLSALHNNLFIIRSANGYYRMAKYIGTDLNKADNFLNGFKSTFDPDAWLLLME